MAEGGGPARSRNRSEPLVAVERVCDEIAILDGGRLVAQGTFEELSEKRGGGSLEHIFAELTSEGSQAESVERLLAALGETARA